MLSYKPVKSISKPTSEYKNLREIRILPELIQSIGNESPFSRDCILIKKYSFATQHDDKTYYRLDDCPELYSKNNAGITNGPMIINTRNFI